MGNIGVISLIIFIIVIVLIILIVKNAFKPKKKLIQENKELKRKINENKKYK